ncbi:MAG TPA: SIS domain-containing protein [Bacteroidales bacterium]|nr:SIS domain-containing protein [Bacteroidales bacterium]
MKKNLDLITSENTEAIIDLIFNAGINNKTIFIIGNGGSASNASHLAQDLSRARIFYQEKECRVKALSLTDNISFITAVGNDFGYENIFSYQLQTFAEEGDVLIAISCSGNSKNVISAVHYAHSKNMTVVGITGFDGGELKRLSEINLHIPLDDFGIVESIHSAVFHYLAIELRTRFSE